MTERQTERLKVRQPKTQTKRQGKRKANGQTNTPFVIGEEAEETQESDGGRAEANNMDKRWRMRLLGSR